MWDHRARWKFIGVEWGINAGTLAAIEVDHKTVDDCIFKLIQIWLNQPQDSPRPTRSAIKAALQSRRVLVADGTIIIIIGMYMHACTATLDLDQV